MRGKQKHAVLLVQRSFCTAAFSLNFACAAQQGDALFQGAAVMTDMRLSVKRYFMETALTMAATDSGSQSSVAPKAMFTARSPLCGGDSKCSFSSLKSYFGASLPLDEAAAQ